ncbi:MAG: UDP-N-acetylglucosamine 1-carboxyvinyltransferase [Kordiimonas sp.]|nr:UDP-N-acetylglucosamine 1-carboxyvinyltransferase [Kordiimonas sp.]
MEKIVIQGGARLEGQIPISGAKNAALPLMAASLLTSDTLTLGNIPDLADIRTLSQLLTALGVGLNHEKSAEKTSLSFTARDVYNTTAPYDIVRKMRASILVLGPLLARFGEATVSLPGGCAIGNRPIDLHLKGFEDLGADIELADGYVRATAPKGLKGAVVHFPVVSVGATENILMAACLADGETVIENAAREPEISDLAHCLQAMGAQIEGLGTERLVIQGQPQLHGAQYNVMADRIEAGSYIAAAAMTHGKIEILGQDLLPIMTGFADTLKSAGVSLTPTDGGILATLKRPKVKGLNVVTQPYPGFPTDMQAQIMAMMTLCDGASVITETIFENRYMHVPELTRMGADITVHGSTATVRGVSHLTGAPVMATDLRASMSLVLAGLAAEGETTVNRIYHLDRGYERLTEKLYACGARIQRQKAENT